MKLISYKRAALRISHFCPLRYKNATRQKNLFLEVCILLNYNLFELHKLRLKLGKKSTLCCSFLALFLLIKTILCYKKNCIIFTTFCSPSCFSKSVLKAGRYQMVLRIYFSPKAANPTSGIQTD